MAQTSYCLGTGAATADRLRSWLHGPFSTFSLPLVDWGIVIGAALTISPVLELAKWMERRGWFGNVD